METKVNRYTMPEFVEAAKQGYNICINGTKSKRNKTKLRVTAKDYNFFHSNSFAEAVEICNKGFMEATAAINFESNGVAIQRRNIRGVVGCPIVPLALQGAPFCMMRRRSIPTISNSVNIYLNISYHCRITTDEIIQYAQNVLNFVESARTTKQVKIYTVISSSDTKENKSVDIVEIYDSAKNNSVAAVSFAICHPSMLRRFWFAYSYTFDNWQYVDAHPEEITIEEQKQYFGEGSYYINAGELKQYKNDFSDAIVR